ncbi:hypothetical protein [Candidatus Nanohalobium constans]|uniref:Esterase n=1 Tax=Candidatus Nanohalobium constans TaxID=2565781 RepID=A0A5Q0UGC7_9ARCH|nr:hypothetical protein [Candidatus Nanohalobium constans]QGA80702.1 esterase [Candidatus Nanohalobium constans]
MKENYFNKLKDESTKIVLTVFFLSIVSVAALMALQASGDGSTESSVEEVFFVGGEGPQERAEVYKFSDSEGGDPVVMVPGLGLDEYIYTDTPDDRDGWAQIFDEKGYTSYVYNPPNIVDSNETVDDSVSTSQWSLGRAWSKWGFGPQQGEAYDDSKYPVSQIQELEDNFPQYTSTRSGQGGASGQSSRTEGQGGQFDGNLSGQSQQSGRSSQGSAQGGMSFGSEASTEALIDLLERTGPATVIVHSAEGATGFEVARQRPELIETLVAVEPVGCPETESQVFSGTEFVAVYGDYVQERGQTGRKQACETTIDLINENGGEAEMISLPDMGIEGNSHLLMQGENNQEIAEKVMSEVQS